MIRHIHAWTLSLTCANARAVCGPNPFPLAFKVTNDLLPAVFGLVMLPAVCAAFSLTVRKLAAIDIPVRVPNALLAMFKLLSEHLIRFRAAATNCSEDYGSMR